MPGPADFVLNPLPGSVQLATSLFTVSAVGTPVKPENSTIVYSASGDLTGDGWPEIVISGWTFRGWDAAGTPTPAPLTVFSTSAAGVKMLDAAQLFGTATSPGTAILRIADFTGDSRNDLLMAGHNESGFVPTQSTLFVNTGVGFTQKPFGPKVTAHEGEVGDINGDGRLDVVLSAYHTDKTLEPYLFNGFSGWYTAGGTGMLVIEVNQGNGVFKALPLAISQTLEQAKANPQPWTIQNWNAGSASTMADLDNDGKAEVIIVDAFNNVGAKTRGDSAIITDVVLGDTMASGRLIQLPAPYFEDNPKYAGLAHSGFEYSHDVQVQVMDFDNDGLKDIIVSSFVWAENGQPSASILQFLKNAGGLKFTDVTDKVLYNQYLGRAESGHENVFMDVNGDGFLDIVVPGESVGHAVPKQWTNFTGEQYVAYDRSWSNEILINTGNGKFVSVMWDQFHQFTLAQAGLFPTSAQPFGAQDGRYFPYMTPDGRLGFITTQIGYAGGGNSLFFFNVEAKTQIHTGPGGADPALRGAPGFNEAFYLTENPAVAQAVAAGTYASGLDHYLAVGRAQGLAAFAPGVIV
ncbi:MAG: VCBS repeat-containing protein, partial [Phenylobacterium sp.]